MAVCIIAEAGVNHNGSMEMAKDLVRAAAEAGADIVKFQTFKAEQIASRKAPKAAYQQETTDAAESQIEMLKKLELPFEAHQELMDFCKQCGIGFLSTPFDGLSLRFLVHECGLETVKVPSGEITNAPFLLEIARTGRDVILSTGMSTLGEIETALGVLAFGYLHREKIPKNGSDFVTAYADAQNDGLLRRKVRLLHCTTEYPAPFDEVNLAAMDALRQAFGLSVGYSDHTEGISVPLAAVARGASIIEKHFTLDRSLPGPDHKASLEPKELKTMVVGIRQIEAAIGDGRKMPTTRERKNLSVVRKSLVAKCTIKAGERFSEANLTVKRPAAGIAPMRYWELLDKKASRDYGIDEPIQE